MKKQIRIKLLKSKYSQENFLSTNPQKTFEKIFEERKNNFEKLVMLKEMCDELLTGSNYVKKTTKELKEYEMKVKKKYNPEEFRKKTIYLNEVSQRPRGER